jgi:hypothetical protein
MVSRTRLKSILTGLALYTMAALMVGYFGVNAYTGKYGLNARQELDQEIIGFRCCGPTGSILTCWMSARATSSTTPIRAIWSGPSSRTDFQTAVTNTVSLAMTSVRVRKFQKTVKSISKMSRRAAVRHSNIFFSARNPFTPV